MKAIYVNFEQAKLLFEKGFNLFTENTKSVALNNRYGDNEYYSFYKDTTNWDVTGYPSLKEKCVVTFHEKVGTNSSEINSLLCTYNVFKGNNGGIKSYLAAEQWQVIEWLRVNHDIWIKISVEEWCKEDIERNFSWHITSGKYTQIDGCIYNSPQEASSVAFDYILKELI